MANSVAQTMRPYSPASRLFSPAVSCAATNPPANRQTAVTAMA